MASLPPTRLASAVDLSIAPRLQLMISATKDQDLNLGWIGIPMSRLLSQLDRIIRSEDNDVEKEASLMVWNKDWLMLRQLVPQNEYKGAVQGLFTALELLSKYDLGSVGSLPDEILQACASKIPVGMNHIPLIQALNQLADSKLSDTSKQILPDAIKAVHSEDLLSVLLGFISFQAVKSSVPNACGLENNLKAIVAIHQPTYIYTRLGEFFRAMMLIEKLLKKPDGIEDFDAPKYNPELANILITVLGKESPSPGRTLPDNYDEYSNLVMKIISMSNAKGFQKLNEIASGVISDQPMMGATGKLLSIATRLCLHH